MSKAASGFVATNVLCPIRLFLIFAPIVYLAHAFIDPPFQTSDEHSHLFRAFQLSSFEVIGERRGQEAGGELPPSLARAASEEIGNPTPHVSQRPRIKATLSDRFSRLTPLDSDEHWRFTNFLGAVTYTPAGYGPQVVAVWIGRTLDLPIEVILRLGRILNAALAIGLFYIAFRILPVGRLVLLVVALFPITAAYAASFGQDGLVTSGSAVLTALGVRAVVLQRWTTREALLAGLMACLITLAKFIYLPLAGLALLPVPPKTTFWRWAMPPILFGGIALLLTALWLHAVSGLFVPMLPGMAAPGDQVRYLLSHPLAFSGIMIDTYSQRTGYLIAMAYLFGWLNVGPVFSAVIPCFAALAVALWYGDNNARSISWTWRAWALFVTFATIALMTLALYILGSRTGETVVNAIQGRYFVPLALPAMIPLLRQRAGDQRLAAVAIVLLSGMANIFVLSEIYDAFYV